MDEKLFDILHERLNRMEDHVNKRFDKVDDTTTSLLAFKWKAAGALTLINFVVLAILQIFFH